MAAEHPEAILGLPGIQSTPGESTAATGILTRAINPTGAQLRLNRHRWPMNHWHIQEGPAQGIGRLQPGLGAAMCQMQPPHL